MRDGMSDGTIGASRAREQRRNSVIALACSVAVQVLVFTALFWPYASAPTQEETSVAITMIDLPNKPPGPSEEADMAAGGDVVLPTPPQPVPAPVLNIATTPMVDNSDVLSDAQIAGAGRAGVGASGGGVCDMARAVQQALRRDPQVRTAVEKADRLGKAIMLWNGDWVRSGEQEGKGLATVRQAIIWEVAFSPASCRNQRMRGLLVLSLADESTRFAIGSNEWRWSDLLDVQRMPSNP